MNLYHPFQQEIFEAVVKSKDSTYASVAQSTSALPEGQSKVISHVVKEKKTNSKVVLNGAGKNSNLEIVGKMPKRKAIFLSRLGPSTTVNDITNYLSSLSAASDDQDVILITETWLCEDIDSLELFDDRYLVFRRDRGSSLDSCRRGEGVLIAVKKCFNPCILDLPGSDLEAVWLSIKLNHRQKMLVCVVYFPPSSRADTYVEFFDCFENFGCFDNILIYGDFNLPIYDDFGKNKNPLVNELSNFVNLYNLDQFNNNFNCNNKFLDLILTDIDFSHISVWHSDKPLVPEDKHHPALSISICFVADHPNRKNMNISRYDFRSADFLAMWCFFREIDWSFLLNFNDIDKAVFSFYNCLNDVFSRTVPLRQTVTRRFPFWYTIETRRLLNRKARVRRLALKCVNPDSVDEFRALRSAVKYSIQKDYNTYLRLTENNLISNHKKFWSYFNNTKHNSPNSLYYNNVCYENDGDIANAFADYFKSVFKPSTNYDIKNEFKINCVGDLVKIDSVTYDDVVLAIRELKSSLTVGVDNIPSFIMKGCAEFFIYPLLILFNLSLRSNEPRSGFLQRFPYDITTCEERYKYTVVGFDGDVFGVRKPLKNHFGVSSVVRDGELSAIESAVTVILSELLTVFVDRSSSFVTIIASDLRPVFVANLYKCYCSCYLCYVFTKDS
ncbi:hypothetical protein AVEN_240941-1 [Araneus ventricosus]|uniref:Endonuclease/exonuclease/phosphatase domain-containing protein n=1 Tax=Araneus ventricosus TaxID=182803 RepID=A0A4Y2JVD9_ARAVE|nr:hypothetical protein AVEN_240941-1 [Araneus ventricosus]